VPRWTEIVAVITRVT